LIYKSVMPVAKVHRISAAAPDDLSGIEAAIAGGRMHPKGVLAVLGKTEGNGLVNDFTRGFATSAMNALFRRFLPAGEADAICLVMSGGTEGGMSPHWTVFERSSRDDGQKPALAIGRAHTEALSFEHLGRLQQVDQVRADGHARCGHFRSCRRSFRADQVSAAHRGAHGRDTASGRNACHDRYAEIHGAVAGGERAWRCRGVG
jgi:hypothetical protein